MYSNCTCKYLTENMSVFFHGKLYTVDKVFLELYPFNL